MDVYFECCVLYGRGLCVGLITRPEESYRLWCVVVCDLETLNVEGLAHWGLLRPSKKEAGYLMTPSKCWGFCVDRDEMTLQPNGLWRKPMWPISRYSSNIRVIKRRKITKGFNLRRSIHHREEKNCTKVFIFTKIKIKYLLNANQDPAAWSYRVTPLTTIILILVVYKRYLPIPAALLI